MRDKIKVVFLDRDGTIIEDYPDEKWGEVKTPVFLNGAIHTLKRLRESNYEIIILTNQYIINQGIISLEQYYEFTRRLVNILLDNDIVLKDIFFCPHTKESLQKLTDLLDLKEINIK